MGVETSQSTRLLFSCVVPRHGAAPCFAGVTGEIRVRSPSALGHIMQTPEISVGGLIK